MAKIELPYSHRLETYGEVLKEFIQRYSRDYEPVSYKSITAVGKSTSSQMLKSLSRLGILETPKQGWYEIDEEVLEALSREDEKSTRKLDNYLDGNPIYSEIKTIVESQSKPTNISTLAERVAKSPDIGAYHEEGQKKIERSIELFGQIGLLDIEEDEVMLSVNESKKSEKNESSSSSQSAEQPRTTPNDLQNTLRENNHSNIKINIQWCWDDETPESLEEKMEILKKYNFYDN